MATPLQWDSEGRDQFLTPPARFFFDPDVFAAEKKNIFFKSWHVVGHKNELREPGQFLTQEIFDQSVIVIADNNGDIGAFHNVCQHRGNRLMEERRGANKSMIRCGYHSWCYGLDGALRSAPRTDGLQNFDKAAYGLRPVRLETFAGFVFVNLDPNARSLSEIVSGADAEMMKFLPDLDDLELIEEVDVIVPANWKIIQENSIEGYHFDLSGPAHKELTALIDFKSYRLTEHDLWWTYMAPPKPGTSTAYGAPLDGASWQTDWFFNIGLWPNTTFYCFPFTDMVGTFIMIPLEPEKSLLRFGYYGPKGRKMPAVTKAAIDWMNNNLGPEDIRLNVSNQKGLHSMGFSQGRYMIDGERANQSEHLVHHFHRLCYLAAYG